jgi:hypothetical protein
MLKLYNSHTNLIMSRAWYYAKKYSFEMNELKSQAHLIFCNAVKSYDTNKAMFSTHLYHQLSSLNDYCRKEVSYSKYRDLRPPKISCEWLDRKIDRDKLAEEILSEDAKKLLRAITAGRLASPAEAKCQRIPNIYRAQQVMHWGEARVKRSWAELQKWWRILESA